MRLALAAGLGLIGLAAYAAARPVETLPAASDEPAPTDELLNAVEDAVNVILPVRSLMWSPEKVPAQYRATIAAAEAANGIPPLLLARLLWQESRFRPDIISGRTRSPAGALGIAQFMPATAAELGIDPLNPEEAIPGAARYLASLYRQAGSWALALAAYNWGIGNVLRKGIGRAPLETRNYYGQILADLGMEGVGYA